MRLRFLLLGFLAFCSTVFGQSSTFPGEFEVLTTENDLPSNYVWTIFQDSTGLIWLGTSEGLCFYDGYGFTTFKKEDRPDSLPDNKIIRVRQDPSSAKLWLATEKAGVALFDPIANKSINFRHNPNDPNSLSTDVIADLYVDSKGRVWILTEAGLNRYKGDGFERYLWNSYLWNNKETFFNGRLLLELEDDRMLIVAGKGIIELDISSKRVSRTEFSSSAGADFACHSVFRAPDGTIWIGTNRGTLYQYDPTTKSYREMVLPVRVRINTLLKLSDDRLLVGTFGSGLLVFDTENLKVIEQISRSRRGSTLSSNFITCIYRDKTGVLWIGSEAGGLIRYSPYRNRFSLYKSDPRNPNSLSDQMIRSIVTDKEGKLWVATQSGGLNVYDPQTDTWRHFRQAREDKRSLPSDSVFALLADSKGNIWVGTRDRAALCKFKAGGFDCVLLDGDVGLNCLLEDSRGTIWVGSSLVSKLVGGTLVKVLKLGQSEVQALYEASDGLIWVGTMADGLLAIDPTTGAVVRRFKPDPAKPEALSHPFVTSITEDRKGRLVVTTKGGGVNICTDRVQGRFQNIGIRQGLPHLNSYACLEDKAGNFWISTDVGIYRYNPDTGDGYTFTVRDGLQGDEFNRFAYHKAPDGRFYFGGVNGLNSFFPENVNINTRKPNVLFTRLSKLNETKFLMTSAVDKLVLDYTDLLFAIDFTTDDYSVPKRNRFKYKMEGLNKDWVMLKEGEYSVNFTGLAPGEYLLSIQGSNNDGVWSDPKTLTITILPPWWRSNLAYAVYLITITASIFGVIRIRLVSLRKRNLELERLVAERTREIASQRDKILSQKNEIEEQRTQILDSIRYAKRIQQAIFPDIRELKEYFPGCFIVQKPKDIVSGDFVWVGKINEASIVAVADCTGHGVPGALMSIIGEMLLTQIVLFQQKLSPNEILVEMDSSINKLFGKLERERLQDGMEIAVCVFTSDKLFFAGARQPLYYVNHVGEVVAVKADKWPVGGKQSKKSYILHALPLKDIDMIYLATDGLQESERT